VCCALMLGVGIEEMEMVVGALMLGVGAPEKLVEAGADTLGVGSSEPVGVRSAVREPGAVPLADRVAVAQPLGDWDTQADEECDADLEADTEALTHNVAVRERDREGGTVPVTVTVMQGDAEALGVCVPNPAREGVGAELAEIEGGADAEGDTLVLTVGVTLVQMSTITTDPSLPAPFATPPPAAGWGAHPTPLAAKEEPPPPPAGTL